MNAHRYVIACATVLVAACSGEPSSGDIEKAVRMKYEAAQLVATEMAGAKLAAKLKTEVHSVRKIDCKAGDNAKVYQCNVELDMTVPMIGRQKLQVPTILVKGPDGWRLPG
jgi:hypothetical protein